MSFSDRVLGFGAFPNRETAYEIDQSLLFDNYYSNYFHRTPSSAGDRDKWTFSCWVKRGDLAIANETALFAAYDDANNRDVLRFKSTDTLELQVLSGGTSYNKVSTAKYRDPAAWYHIVAAYDSANATADYRIRLYVNGSEITDSTGTDPSSGLDSTINNSEAHYIGARNADGSVTLHWDGCLAEVHFIDGTVLTPSSFGEADSTTGQWLPKEYDTTSGAYSTNGFYLKFVSGALGTDSSGEGNNYTAAGGIGNENVRLDVPTNNFCTLNPLDKGSYATLLNGNLKNIASGYSTIADRRIVGTMGYHTSDTQGYYWEILYVDNAREDLQTIGVQRAGTTSGQGSSATNSYKSNEGQYGISWSGAEAMYIYYPYDPDNDPDGATTGGGSDNDGVIVGIAVKGSKIWIRINGSWRGDGDPAGDSDPFYTIPAAMAGHYLPLGAPWQGHSGGGGSAIDWRWNFGQDGGFWGAKTWQGNKDANGYGDFYYSVPTGFLALCSKNLPTPTIAKGTDHFNTVTYTGDGSTNAITGVGFQPDFSWFKSRSDAYDHDLVDAVRGVNKAMASNNNSAEASFGTNYTIDSFDSDGFTLHDATYNNADTKTYVAWNWKANGSGSSNTDGSINTAATSANTTAGFSISTYEGNGTSGATVGHGLGVKPNMILIKSRGSADSWLTYFSVIGAEEYMALQVTQASGANTGRFNDTEPTTSVFSLGDHQAGNTDGEDYVAYCFAEIQGYSKFGFYTGTDSTTGAFVYTGFAPAWVMIKREDTENTATNLNGSHWGITDIKRNTHNPRSYALLANSSAVEDTSNMTDSIDFLSNGFKFNSGEDTFNGSGTYVYAAFAESPFKYSNAR